MSQYSKIERPHIIQAMSQLDDGQPQRYGTPTIYRLMHRGRAYAPKEVVALAIEIATGKEPTWMHGGVSDANAILVKRGFDVVKLELPIGAARWWSMGTGEGGEAWPTFQSEGCIAHRGGGLGDLRTFESVAAIEDALAAIRPIGDPRPSQDARGNWNSVHEQREGDMVIARIGLSRAVGIGLLRSGYSFEPTAEAPYRHRHKCAWLWIGNHQLPPSMVFHRKTLTEISDRPEILNWAKEQLTAAGFRLDTSKSATVFQVGSTYTRAQIRSILGLPSARGGAWDTGYVRHEDEWFLFPNVGIAGRTGHDYGNRWEGKILRWFGKTDTSVSQPEMKRLLSGDSVVHLFAREADRDPFTYFGRVRTHKVIGGTPVEVLWEVIPATDDLASGDVLPQEVDPNGDYFEGAIRTVTVNAYERDRGARTACIKHWGRTCAVCGLRMSDRYGPIAETLIHVHHLNPIASIGKEYKIDPVNDLRPVCPNCHAVIHIRKQVLTIEEAQLLLDNNMDEASG